MLSNFKILAMKTIHKIHTFLWNYNNQLLLPENGIDISYGELQEKYYTFLSIVHDSFHPCMF